MRSTKTIRNGRAEESDKLEAANPLPPLPISKLIDHIDHIVKVAGIDHVGIGGTSMARTTCPKARRMFRCCRTSDNMQRAGAPLLLEPARAAIIEYVEEKAAASMVTAKRSDGDLLRRSRALAMHRISCTACRFSPN